MLAALRARALAVMVLAGAVACAAYNAPAVSDVPNHQRDVITQEEILASPHRLVDLYQAVRGLRPHFIEPPTAKRAKAYATLVFIDGVRQGNGLATLASIPAATVERVEYLDPGRAESQYGNIGGGGAVLVTMVGQRRVPASARDTSQAR